VAAEEVAEIITSVTGQTVTLEVLAAEAEVTGRLLQEEVGYLVKAMKVDQAMEAETPEAAVALVQLDQTLTVDLD
jgi:hypothetical protein